MEASSAALASPPEGSYRFRYHGEGAAFFILILKNALLTLVTVGIYAAWAKAERRRYIWSNVEFHGQRLEFTGNGLELFKGYLKVVAAYFVLFGIPGIVGATGQKDAQLVLQGIAGVALLVLIPFAIYRSRAYILSRTRWRSIRLGLDGSAGPYVRAFLVGALLSIVTLGIYSPWMACKLRSIMVNNTRLGSEKFRYDGRGGELFPIWIKGLLLTIVTLGIYSFWMQAAMARYHLAHTRIGNAHVRFGVTGGHLLQIALVQILGTTLTLGIAFPWIVTWALRSMLEKIDVVGSLDFGLIVQRSSAGGAGADALADALDVGLGV
jgi:uncharacterized membrane protein YjgN (DUF898 family)